MISIILMVLRFAWPFLLVGGAYLWADYSWCNGACRAEHKHAVTAQGKITVLQGRLDELDRERIAQQERWAQATAAEEQRSQRDAASRTSRFTGIRGRILADDRLRITPLPIPAGVLNDAYAAAEPAPSTQAPVTTAATDPSAADYAAWSVDLLQWSADCKARVTDWELFYKGLQK